MQKARSITRKIIVGAVGFPIIVLGIILIPLPGPGLLVSLLGFFILSHEFEWAARPFERAKVELAQMYRTYREKLK